MYFEATKECHSLNLNYGGTAVGIGTVANRMVKIKVSKILVEQQTLNRLQNQSNVIHVDFLLQYFFKRRCSLIKLENFS